MARQKKKHYPAKRINWHPAFVQALQLELFDYKDVLEFKHEYQLTAAPLQIDLIIIKKPEKLLIDKNIARIFKSWNICEYKNPGKSLSIKDFLKVSAYANLYAAITPGVDLSGITLTFVENRYPRKLIRYLTNIRHYMVKETLPGIHTVSGDFLPIQIIESKKLPEAENLWLKGLTYDLEVETANVILEEGQRQAEETPLDAYLDVLTRANPDIFLEVQAMAKRKPRRSFEEVFTEAGIIPEWKRQGGEEKAHKVAQNLINRGQSLEDVAEITELDLATVKTLAQAKAEQILPWHH
jgi:hypothetical protein